MSLLEKIINKTVIEISPKDIYGVKAIATGVFSRSNLQKIELPDTCEIIYSFAFLESETLKEVVLPSSIKKICGGAFKGCSALTSVILNVSPECLIRKDAFYGTPYYDNATENLYSSDGKILIKYVSSPVSNSVINLAAGTGLAFTVDSHLNIPDHIQIIGGEIATYATKMTLGTSTRVLSTKSIPTSITTLICKQPAGMKIELPSSSGDQKGLTYDKNARSMTIYTDNEDIKNYDWAGDNVTPTFYSLSEAPV